MIKNKEDITTIFSIFHDGVLSFDKEKDNMLLLKIDCPYLAELIQQNFTFFWVKIFDCSLLEFNPWWNSDKTSNLIWSNKEAIFQLELDILSANVKNNLIEVACNSDHEEMAGGLLFLDCKGINIFDQDWRELSLEKLT